jgi:hypothetical protein
MKAYLLLDRAGKVIDLFTCSYRLLTAQKQIMFSLANLIEVQEE